MSNITLTVNGQEHGFSLAYLAKLIESAQSSTVQTQETATAEYTIVDWLVETQGDKIETAPKVVKVETPTRKSQLKTVRCDSLADLIKALRDRSDQTVSFDPDMIGKAERSKINGVIYGTDLFGSGLNARHLPKGKRGKDGYLRYQPTKQGKAAGFTKIAIRWSSGQAEIRKVTK